MLENPNQKTVYANGTIKDGLRRLLYLVNSYEPKMRTVLQKRVCRFTEDKDGVLIQYSGKAHNYGVYVRKQNV